MARRKLPEFLRDDEVERLLALVNPKTTSGLRTRAMLAAMLGAGLRVSEVVALDGRDVDVTEGVVRVRDGKGGRDRTVPVDRETLGWLAAWAEKRETLGLNGRAPFFPRLRTKGIGDQRLARGGRLSVRAVQAVVNRLVRAAGVETERQGPHLLRHTAASRWLRRGLTLAEVRDLLGHADVRTTSIYLHADPQVLRQKLQNGGRTQAQAVAEALLANLPEDVRRALAVALQD